MFIWPSNAVIPDPDITLAGDLDQNALRIDMDSGRTRQRRRFTEGRMVYKVTWTLTQQQYQILRSILKYKLNDGTDYFQWSFAFGGGYLTRTMRIIDGNVSADYQDVGFWVCQCQIEEIFQAGFCTPNIASFLTNPLGAVDLSQYFGVVWASPYTATQWRIHTDECGYNIQYYLGNMNPDGTMNPGTNVVHDPANGINSPGWNSADLSFWSVYPYHEGLWIQLNCGGLWSSLPCIEGGNGSPSDPGGL